jgi:hypothetical protein
MYYFFIGSSNISRILTLIYVYKLEHLKNNFSKKIFHFVLPEFGDYHRDTNFEYMYSI